jgi:glucose-1-phosphate thymidylyltransferase
VKALVLAGGSGTRLRPITYTSAKQLVPLANTPILFFGLRAIASAGITDVGIVVGDTHEEIRAAVGDGSRFGLRVTYLRQDAPRGLAHAVLISRDFLGDEPFVMYLGDNLVVGGIDAFVREFERDRPEALLLLAKVEHPEQFGVAELDADGELVRLVEKPADPPSDLALVGVYLFDPAVHEAVRAIEPSERGELEITDAIGWLVAHGRTVRTHLLTTTWIDTGKLTDLLEANRIVLDGVARDVRGSVDVASALVGNVVLEPGAEILHSVVRGPAVIAAGTRVVDSFVGPFTSIAKHCTITDSELEHSVVLEGARIEGVRRIVDSLIGRSARVVRSGEQPPAYRMHIADHSDISVV